MATANRWNILEDADLVLLAQSGSLEACDELVCRFRSGVLFVAGQIVGSREIAEDVAQEAFLLAFGGLAQLREPDKFGGWLHAIARNRARRIARREGRSETEELGALEYLLTEQNGGWGGSPLDLVLQSESQQIIRQLLSDLTPPVQSVLHLFYYAQWPAPRIAEFLSLPLTTVKWRLHTGKRQIGAALVALTNTPDAPVQKKESSATPKTRHEKVSSPVLSGAIPASTSSDAAHKAAAQTLSKEKNNVGTRPEKRDTKAAQPVAENDGTGRTCRADGQLRKRRSQFSEALQCDCRPSGRK